MALEYFENKTFDKINFTLNPITKGEYEQCWFINCDFSNSDLSEIRFLDCEFESCNLSLANLNKTAFQNVKFSNCKMLGLHFENCNDFGFSVSFNACNLSHSSFYKTKLKKTVFKDLNLQEVDFAECDLTSSVFDNCDLTGVIFDNTIIEKADFRTSFNFSINPETNRIKKARFSVTGLAGLLDKYDIEIS
jgi:fluoroquinolone resistance protein